jgi:protein-S-isoprenylcysteine O-methyltransferase Ste14
MELIDEMKVQGSWLFRWRSYVPIALVILMLPPSLVGLSLPFGSYQFHKAWECICLAISLTGLLIRCMTVGFVPEGTSGRGTTKQRASLLNTTGMYSVVRHPLYLGNYFVGLGVTMVWCDWWAPVIYSLCFWLYYERIMIAEEQFLSQRFGEEFRQWASATPAFIPSLFFLSRWSRPSLPFSILSTVRREYSTLVLIMTLHAGMEAIEMYLISGRINFTPVAQVIFTFTLALYLLLKLIKSRTKLLKVSGR